MHAGPKSLETRYRWSRIIFVAVILLMGASAVFGFMSSRAEGLRSLAAGLLLISILATVHARLAHQLKAQRSGD
jgi:hypothetical protein